MYFRDPNNLHHKMFYTSATCALEVLDLKTRPPAPPPLTPHSPAPSTWRPLTCSARSPFTTQTDQDEGFDNFGASILTLYMLTTTENYPDVMYPALDRRPVQALIFFVVFLLVVLLILLPLTLAIVSDFYDEQNKTDKKGRSKKEHAALSAAYSVLLADTTTRMDFEIFTKLADHLPFLQHRHRDHIKALFRALDKKRVGTIDGTDFVHLALVVRLTRQLGSAALVSSRSGSSHVISTLNREREESLGGGGGGGGRRSGWERRDIYSAPDASRLSSPFSSLRSSQSRSRGDVGDFGDTLESKAGGRGRDVAVDSMSELDPAVLPYNDNGVALLLPAPATNKSLKMFSRSIRSMASSANVVLHKPVEWWSGEDSESRRGIVFTCTTWLMALSNAALATAYTVNMQQKYLRCALDPAMAKLLNVSSVPSTSYAYRDLAPQLYINRCPGSAHFILELISLVLTVVSMSLLLLRGILGGWNLTFKSYWMRIDIFIVGIMLICSMVSVLGPPFFLTDINDTLADVFSVGRALRILRVITLAPAMQVRILSRIASTAGVIKCSN